MLRPCLDCTWPYGPRPVGPAHGPMFRHDPVAQAGPARPLGRALGLTFGTTCRPGPTRHNGRHEGPDHGPTWPVWQPANIKRPSPRLSPSQTLILISKDSTGRRLARSPSARAEKGSAAAARLQPSPGTSELLSARLRLLPSSRLFPGSLPPPYFSSSDPSPKT